MNDIGEIGMANRLATEGQYEGFAPVRINVGGGVTQEFYGVGHCVCLIPMGTFKNALFPQLRCQPRARILMYVLYTEVLRSVLPSTCERITIFKDTHPRNSD